MTNQFKYLIYTGIAAIALSSCQTGIENTKTITMTKEEQREIKTSAEDLLMSQIAPLALQQWHEGKEFLISDDKGSIVFGMNAESGQQLRGDTIRYTGTSSRRSPGGGEILVLHFRDGNKELRYDTGRTRRNAMSSLSGMDIPMVIDLDVVSAVDSLLRGRRIWLMSDLRYSDSGERYKGRKFVPVEVVAAMPGNAVFPIVLNLRDETGSRFHVFMNLKSTGIESRTFGSLFSLADPKLRYPQILPEVWNLIQEGKVRAGMTKDECRLSLGNPIDVSAGHSWSATLDYWQYANGMFLRFEDGLLLMFK